MAEPRVALVTGGNRGIGFEVCRQLAKRGLRVVLTARTLPKAESAARTLQADGLAVVGARLDVADGTTVAALARNVAKQFRGIDVLVNNAAILLAENQDLLDTAIDDFRSTFETNVLGAIGVSQAFVPGMIAQRYGRVVNVSSRAGQLVTMSTYAPAYSISKTALNAFTRQLAAATKGTGVLVNSACPGWVRTRMGGPHAPRSVEEGADTLVWLATLPTNGPTGGFFEDRQPIEW